MNHIAASFIRITTRRVTEGSLPPCERFDEWAIYQQDLEHSRLLAQAVPDETRNAGRATLFRLATGSR